MSEAPPNPTKNESATKPDPASPEQATEKAPEQASEPAKEAAPATPGALDQAAKAMDAAAPKIAEVPASTGQPTPLSPSAAANTSGMHLQYVAPGVRRQSFLESTKYQMVLAAGMLVAGFFMFRGGIGGDLSGGVDNGSHPSTATTLQATADPVKPPGDSTYQPLQNRVPAADLTVNAGAIGGDNVPAHSRFDASVNKGGYIDERTDLEAAEAMIAKDPDKALAMVDQHDKDYPRGIMDPDARLVRIEAFQKKGDEAKALALGNEFLEDYPHSPRAGRVQTIVEALKNKNGGAQP